MGKTIQDPEDNISRAQHLGKQAVLGNNWQWKGGQLLGTKYQSKQVVTLDQDSLSPPTSYQLGVHHKMEYMHEWNSHFIISTMQYFALNKIMEIFLPLINAEETEAHSLPKFINSRNRAQTWLFELQMKYSFPFAKLLLV